MKTATAERMTQMPRMRQLRFPRGKSGVSATKEDGPQFRAYLAAIEKFPELTPEKELQLARRWRLGDREAGEQLLKPNLRHVARIASRYRGYGLPLADLIAEGNVGLIEAMRRFEPQRGLRFITYAAYWIRAMMLAYIPRQWSMVGLGSGPLDSKLFFGLRSERARLAGRGCESDETIDGKLAVHFGTTEDRVKAKVQRLCEHDFSLDAHVFDDSFATHLDQLADTRFDQEEQFANVEEARMVRAVVKKLWGKLDEREQMIMHQRLMTDGDSVSLADLGKRLGVSRERVRQLESRLKNKLRGAMLALA